MTGDRLRDGATPLSGVPCGEIHEHVDQDEEKRVHFRFPVVLRADRIFSIRMRMKDAPITIAWRWGKSNPNQYIFNFFFEYAPGQAKKHAPPVDSEKESRPRQAWKRGGRAAVP
jgi:hypothetical protein